MQETWVRTIGLEYPLEEGTSTHSSIFAWKIPMDRVACQAAILGIAKSQTTTERLSTAHKVAFKASHMLIL